MARERAQEKIGSGNEEFKRFEEEVVERHQEQVLRELVQKLEDLDRRASGELLESGGYIDKGYVRRKGETSVRRVCTRVKLLKRKKREGSVYGLFDVSAVGRVSQRAEGHCVQVAVGQSFETSRETLGKLCGMTVSRMGIWKVVQRKGKEERAREVLTERQYRNFCSPVWSKQPEAALCYIKRLLPSDAEHHQELNDFCAHIERNIDGMHYDLFGPVRSGVVEKTTDIIVARRMKRRGMTWSRDGGNNLIALRTLVLNQSYDRRWDTPSLPHFLGCNLAVPSMKIPLSIRWRWHITCRQTAVPSCHH